MASRPVSRNNLLAGLFVIASLLLAVFVAVLVSGAQKLLIPTNPYTVRFTLGDGAAGIKLGSLVNLGGQEVGRVVGIDYERPAPDAMPTGVNVRVVVKRSVTLYQDSAAFLERPLLGSMGTINIVRAAPPDAPGSALAPGSVLQGMIAPPSFMAQAGFGPEQARQVQTILTRASDVADRVARLTEKIDNEVDPTLQAFRKARQDVVDVTGLAREKAPQWAASVDKLLAEADGATKDARTAIASIRDAIDTNRPAFDRAMANIDAAAQGVRERSIPTLNAALDDGRAGTADFRRAWNDIADLIREQEPSLRRALANFRLASDQAKLTMTEVRRAPWRLLYSPGTKELESELFYDAARTYAEAVSDLRAASEALEAVSAGQPGQTPAVLDGESLEQLRSRLGDAFRRYDDAERKLLQKMTQSKP